MKARLSALLKVMAVVAFLALVAQFAGDGAQASNMGFKMNRAIAGVGASPTVGENLVALPFRNPYTVGNDICTNLNMDTVLPSAVVSQIDANSGVPYQHSCKDGAGGDFSLLTHVGLTVKNPVATTGILVGSHEPGVSVTLYPLGNAPTKGLNLFPVPYHTTAATANDLCIQAALDTGDTIARNNAPTGVPQQFTCGDAPGSAFNLILGEAVKILPAASHTFTPAHF